MLSAFGRWLEPSLVCRGRFGLTQLPVDVCQLLVAFGQVWVVRSEGFLAEIEGAFRECQRLQELSSLENVVGPLQVPRGGDDRDLV